MLFCEDNRYINNSIFDYINRLTPYELELDDAEKVYDAIYILIIINLTHPSIVNLYQECIVVVVVVVDFLNPSLDKSCFF